jgi:hypothetical protein
MEAPGSKPRPQVLTPGEKGNEPMKNPAEEIINRLGYSQALEMAIHTQAPDAMLIEMAQIKTRNEFYTRMKYRLKIDLTEGINQGGHT